MKLLRDVCLLIMITENRYEEKQRKRNCSINKQEKVISKKFRFLMLNFRESERQKYNLNEVMFDTVSLSDISK